MGAVAKYCDEYVCVSVCMSVQEDISGTTRAIIAIFCMLPMAVVRSSSVAAIRYVFLVLWMTSCFL